MKICSQFYNVLSKVINRTEENMHDTRKHTTQISDEEKDEMAEQIAEFIRVMQQPYSVSDGTVYMAFHTTRSIDNLKVADSDQVRFFQNLYFEAHKLALTITSSTDYTGMAIQHIALANEVFKKALQKLMY